MQHPRVQDILLLCAKHCEDIQSSQKLLQGEDREVLRIPLIAAKLKRFMEQLSSVFVETPSSQRAAKVAPLCFSLLSVICILFHKWVLKFQTSQKLFLSLYDVSESGYP